jgi:hypothetical protein
MYLGIKDRRKPMGTVVITVAFAGMSGVLLVDIALTVWGIWNRPVTVPPPGPNVIRMGSAFLALPAFGTVIPLLAMIGYFFKPTGDLDKALPAVIGVEVGALLLVLWGYVGFLEGLYGHAVLTEEGIEQYSPWWGARSLLWFEVERVYFYQVGAVFLRGTNRRRISFSAFWSGRKKLKDAIRQHVGPELIWIQGPGM